MDGTYVEGLGNVRIAEEVLATIVATAAMEVPGVVALIPRSGPDIKGLLSKKVPARNVRVTEQEGQVTIELNINVQFGKKLQEVALELQTAVKKAVESMTGMTVAAVHVYIANVVTVEEPAPAEEAPVEEETAEEAAEEIEEVEEIPAEPELPVLEEPTEPESTGTSFFGNAFKV
ncbi:MAG: Asp23/Gls24 family envelope stress response protein [Clostridia bacterium]|nr:Asp23/Gls24 family envelope stress response protein [Clostridia bacterium]